MAACLACTNHQKVLVDNITYQNIYGSDGWSWLLWCSNVFGLVARGLWATNFYDGIWLDGGCCQCSLGPGALVAQQTNGYAPRSIAIEPSGASAPGCTNITFDDWTLLQCCGFFAEPYGVGPRLANIKFSKVFQRQTQWPFGTSSHAACELYGCDNVVVEDWNTDCMWIELQACNTNINVVFLRPYAAPLDQGAANLNIEAHGS